MASKFLPHNEHVIERVVRVVAERVAAGDDAALRLLVGLSLEEAAIALAVSRPALKSRLHRARLRFMAAIGGGGPDGG